MKKKYSSIACSFVISIILSSCSTSPSYYSMSGTMAGASIGGQIGEAIGWFSGGHNRYGSSLVGRVIGTAVGAGIGYSITQKQINNLNKQHDNRNTASEDTYNNTFTPESNTKIRNFRIGKNSKTQNNSLCISNISYQDENGDGKISKGETCTIIYEVTNSSQWLISDIVVGISEETNTERYAFSPSTSNVSISPGGTIRYKANVFCKKKPSQSNVVIKLSAYSNEKSMEVYESIKLPTTF